MIPTRLLETMRTGLKATAVTLMISGAAHAAGDKGTQQGDPVIVEVIKPNHYAIVLNKITELKSNDPVVAHAAFKYLKSSNQSVEILNQVLHATKDEGLRVKISAVLKAIEAGHQCVEECGRG